MKLMKKLLILLLFPVLISYNAPTTTGIVVDSATHETLVGVLVSTSSEKTYSNFDGEFNIKGTNPKFQLISYEMDSISNDTIFMSNESDYSIRVPSGN